MSTRSEKEVGLERGLGLLAIQPQVGTHTKQALNNPLTLGRVPGTPEHRPEMLLESARVKSSLQSQHAHRRCRFNMYVSLVSADTRRSDWDPGLRPLKQGNVNPALQKGGPAHLRSGVSAVACS